MALNKHIRDLEVLQNCRDNLAGIRRSARLFSYRIEREVGPNYAEIVRTCLDGGFETSEEFFRGGPKTRTHFRSAAEIVTKSSEISRESTFKLDY